MIDRSDGVDTLAGAFVLIFVCFMASCLIISIQLRFDKGFSTIDDSFEEQFDYILSSSLELSTESEVLILTVGEYLVMIAGITQGGRDLPICPWEDPSQKIAMIIDFYLYDVEWKLSLIISDIECIVIATGGSMAFSCNHVSILERAIPISGDRLSFIQLVITGER